MNEDFMRELARLQRYTAGLSRLMADAQSRLARRAEGSDGSGRVSAVLAPDGLPETLHVRSDWRDALDPARVGDAVVEACRVAANERMASWSRSLEDEGWLARANRLREDVEERPVAAEPVTGRPVGVDQAGPRSMESLAEGVLTEFDTVGRFAGAPVLTATGTGSDRTGHVTITLSKAGVTSCAVDQHWVARQAGTDLNSAFAEALAEARTDLVRVLEQAPDPTARLDQLLGDALSLLADPQRLADS
ncbi:hypothetical protein ACNTMW_03400 [Planosporangium sp. 12N6]|uniref:hypothetical protein n=1 Tax=Planosporangium spinosum TaxID=3402278 RepID=UPI003CF8DA55